MHFDLEIFFTGLCLFQFDTERCDPKKCRVVMVDATEEFEDEHACHLGGERTPGRHMPRLVVPAKNVIVSNLDLPEPDFEKRADTNGGGGEQKIHECFSLGVSESGEAILSLELCDYQVKLTPVRVSRRYPLYVPMHRRKGAFVDPDEEAARPDWFDWVAVLQDIDPEFGVKKCLGIDDAFVASVVHFENGELETFDCGKQRGENLMCDFRTVCGEESPLDRGKGGASHRKGDRRTRALAERIVLRFRRLEYPLRVELWKRRDKSEMHGPDHDSPPDFVFGIGPDRPELNPVPCVKASITNLDRDYHRAQRAIYDFLWFYKLGCWVDQDENPTKPKPLFERLIPWPREARFSGRCPSNPNCPPVAA